MAHVRTSEKFERFYRALNPEQRKAVDAIEGPVMVLAGPGTGKTHLLTMRIANILRLTDTPPESILALTFTDSAAHAMRERLLEIIGAAAYRVHISTFHGFCNDVIRRFPGEFARIIGSTPASEADQLRIMESVITDETLTLEHLRPFGNPFYYVRAALGAIHELKRDALRPEEARRALEREERVLAGAPDRLYESGRYQGLVRASFRAREKQLARQRELIVLYEGYELSLRAESRYDYEDMVMEVVAALERSEDLLLELEERYLYILADEHQDANLAQERLLTLLSSFHERPNLFVVGDDKQAIFRFQGASAANFASFTERYPDALAIDLRENYRSRQRILDAAASAIQHSPEGALRSRVALRAARGKGEPVSVAALSNPVHEALFVAREIRVLLTAGVSPEEIAVVYRDNSDAASFVSLFERLGIPYTLRSDQNALADPLLRQLVMLLRAVSTPQSDEHLSRSLFLEFLGIDHLEVYALLERYETLRRARREAGGARSGERLVHLLRVAPSDAVSQPAFAGGAPRTSPAELQRRRSLVSFAHLLNSWASFAKSRGLLETLELIVRESGFLVSLLRSPEGYERIRKLEDLITELERAVPGHRGYGLSEALRHLDILERYGVSVRSRGEMSGPPGVVLLTAHKAKGLEFAYVYIVRAVDGHWGGRRVVEHFPRMRALAAERGTAALHNNGHPMSVIMDGHRMSVTPVRAAEGSAEDDLHDERRLFYVALTRARESVTITHARAGEDDRRLLPSRFIEEIDPAHRTPVDTAVLEELLTEERRELFAAPKLSGHLPALSDAAFLRERFRAQGLSVTAINNYLGCPWRYFFENLIRVPRSPNRHQLYGIAVHSALRELFDALGRGLKLSEEEFLTSFTRALAREPLSERDFAASLTKGTRALSGYYRVYGASIAAPLRTEMRIGGVTLYPATGHIEHNVPGVSPAPSAAGAGDELTPPPIQLVGVLDKVELLGPGREGLLVTDYKTGRPRTRNDIEGKTKASQGEYKRQLVFYKLLLDRFDEGRFQMEAGEIDFVEPDARGRYHRERFEISGEDVKALEAEIECVIRDIWSLSFWERRCEARECEYCALRELMDGAK